MLKSKNILGLAFLSLCLSGHCALVFTPSTPQVYTGSSVGNDFESVIVNSSENGLAAIWRDSPSNQIMTTISTDLGNSWSPLQVVGPGSQGTFNWLAANQTGILSGNSIHPSANTRPNYYTSFHSNGSWSSPKDIGGTAQPDATDGSQGIFLASSDKGFLATWSWLLWTTYDRSLTVEQNVYVNVSADGMNWLPEPVMVGSTWLENNLPVFPTACIKDNLYLVTWLDNLTFEVKATLSSDGGKTWSAPVTAANAGSAETNSSSINCCALPQGFLLTYSNDVGLNQDAYIYSLFSADGIHWSNPSVVTTSAVEPGDYLPAVSANSCGIVIAWVGRNLGGSGYDIYLSTSDDQGTTWSSPVTLTHDSSVCQPQYLSDVSISLYDNHCVLGWKNKEGNAVMCYGTLTCPGK